jgi:molybdate transport system substrate-binding protein
VNASRRRALKKRAIWSGICSALLCAQAVDAATIRLLSTGAVEAGIRAAAQRFEKASGHTVDITVQTAPEVKRHLEAREVWDLAVATPATIDEQTRAGMLESGAVTLGRVGAGIAVRAGTRPPDIATVESLKRAALEADAIFLSRGTMGQFSEGLLKKLGIFQQVEGRLVRSDRGSEAMQQLGASKGRDIAFGALTEIVAARSEGVVLVGELPAEAQSYTTYVIARLKAAPQSRAAAEFLDYLRTTAGHADFRAQGIRE